MEFNSAIAVSLLLFSPLVASLFVLAGKILYPRFFSGTAFTVWFFGTGAGLYATLDIMKNGAVAVHNMGGWAPPFGISMEPDALLPIVTVFYLLIGSAVWFQSRREPDLDTPFPVFFFLALFSLQGILLTRDLFNLFVWFEVLSLCSFVLIAWFRTPVTLTAAFRYLLISSVSIFLYLLGLWILYDTGGSLSLEHIGGFLEKNGGAIDRSAVGFAIPLIVAGLLTRSAVIPFHTWLPRAHSAAPYPVSALLSGLVIKAPVLALWRFFDYLPFPALGTALLWMGAAGALFASFAAVVQRDTKKILGYSSVGQMGFIIAAFGYGGTAGRTAALFAILAHAAAKALLFLGIGEIGHREESRDVLKLRGLFHFYPVQGILFVIAAASIVGLPLFTGYGAKQLLSTALYSEQAYTLLFLAGIGTAASYFRLGRIFIGRATAGVGKAPARGKNDFRRAAAFGSVFFQILLAALCLLPGLFPSFFLHGLDRLVPGETMDFMMFSTSDWYNSGSLLKPAIAAGAGLLLAILFFTKNGENVAAAVRKREVSLNGSTALLILGFLGLSLFGAITY